MDYASFTERLRLLFSELLPLYIGRAHEKSGTKITLKGDNTPQIDLDNHTLDRLRSLVSSDFPDDFTISEEDKRDPDEISAILKRPDQEQWTIDGLDGTWHLIRGTNSYGAMISRRLGDRILYASIFRPVDMALRGNGFFYAEHGKGAWEWCSDCSLYHPLHAAPYGTLERITVLLEGSSKRFFKPPVSYLGGKVTTRPSLSSCVAEPLWPAATQRQLLLPVTNRGTPGQL
ncbi:MAG: inositol monophosphatase family protein [Patescibacteria group bacterium]